MTAPARTLLADLDQHLDRQVRVCGWVQRIDVAGDARGIALRDHTGVAWLVPATAGDAASTEPVTPESALQALGIVQRGDDGDLQVAVDHLQVASHAPAPLPVTEDSSLQERLDWRYLDLRRPRNRLIFEVQTTAERAMRELWHEQGFLEVHSPKFRATPNKSGDHLFAVDYLDRRAYLAQSPQFYKQMAMSAGFDRVFEIGPVFRAQPIPTSRHDTEFTSVDVELSWIDSDHDVQVHAEQLLHRVLDAVAVEHADAIARHFGATIRVPSLPFPRMTLDEAKELVAATGLAVGGRDEDLDPEGERRLADHVAATHGHEFVVVTDYPHRSRPFFHMRREGDSRASRSFDVVWKGLEIISGAQREHRHEVLLRHAREHELPVEGLRGFLDFFRYGCPPHGGFGLGLTRMLVSMLDLDDVRETTYLFRGPDRLTP